MKFYKFKLQMLKEKTVNYNSIKIKETKDVVDYINSIDNYDMSAEENAILICLNSKNQIIGYTEIAKGNINACVFDVASIFKSVLVSNANKFILAHNHPSGDPTPSNADITVTLKVKDASEIMGISFLDHIIIGDDFISIFEYMERRRK